MPSTREIIQSALSQELTDKKGNPVRIRLLPGLTKDEVDELGRALPVRPPEDVRDLLEFCSGIEGALDQIDFTGGAFRDSFGPDFLLPYGLAIAHDGCGNYWAVDLQPDPGTWGPIYFCCHDAPVMLLQAAGLQQFVNELFKMYIPPHQSLIDDVHEDRLVDVWRKNPGVISHAIAMDSPDPDIRTFAASLDASYDLIDLRGAPIGMGFSWGRYKVIDVKRSGAQPIFAHRRPDKNYKKSLLSRLFAR